MLVRLCWLGCGAWLCCLAVCRWLCVVVSVSLVVYRWLCVVGCVALVVCCWLVVCHWYVLIPLSLRKNDVANTKIEKLKEIAIDVDDDDSDDVESPIVRSRKATPKNASRRSETIPLTSGSNLV